MRCSGHKWDDLTSVECYRCEEHTYTVYKDGEPEHPGVDRYACLYVNCVDNSRKRRYRNLNAAISRPRLCPTEPEKTERPARSKAGDERNTTQGRRRNSK